VGLVLVGVAIDAPERPRPAPAAERVTVAVGAGTMTGDTGDLVQLDVFGVPVSANGRHAAAGTR
jgi:hypothetical protein